MDPSYGASEEEILAGLTAYFGCLTFFVIVMIALQIWLFWRILKKAGMNPWLSLLTLLGGIGTIILMFMLAFGDWPALRAIAAPAYAPQMQPQAPPPAMQPPAPPAAPPAPPQNSGDEPPS